MRHIKLPQLRRRKQMTTPLSLGKCLCSTAAASTAVVDGSAGSHKVGECQPTTETIVERWHRLLSAPTLSDSDTSVNRLLPLEKLSSVPFTKSSAASSSSSSCVPNFGTSFDDQLQNAARCIRIEQIIAECVRVRDTGNEQKDDDPHGVSLPLDRRNSLWGSEPKSEANDAVYQSPSPSGGPRAKQRGNRRLFLLTLRLWNVQCALSLLHRSSHSEGKAPRTCDPCSTDSGADGQTKRLPDESRGACGGNSFTASSIRTSEALRLVKDVWLQEIVVPMLRFFYIPDVHVRRAGTPPPPTTTAATTFTETRIAHSSSESAGEPRNAQQSVSEQLLGLTRAECRELLRQAYVDLHYNLFVCANGGVDRSQERDETEKENNETQQGGANCAASTDNDTPRNALRDYLLHHAEELGKPDSHHYLHTNTFDSLMGIVDGGDDTGVVSYRLEEGQDLGASNAAQAEELCEEEKEWLRRRRSVSVLFPFGPPALESEAEKQHTARVSDQLDAIGESSAPPV